MVIVDGEQAEAFLRPRADVIEKLPRPRRRARPAQVAEFAKLKDTPAVTRDGVKIALADERRAGGRS